MVLAINVKLRKLSKKGKLKMIKYPTRCIIVDAEGTRIEGSDLIRKTPDVSKPYIGETGMAIKTKDGNVKITLDCGKILMGYECWWTPLGKE